MQTKYIMSLLLPVLLLATALPLVAAANTNETWHTAYTNALVAGKHVDVGNIYIWSTDSGVGIRIAMASGFELVETHIHVAGSPSGIPQKNGNPIPGQFMDNVMHGAGVTSYCQTFDVTGRDPIIIAIHAVVRGTGDCESFEETAWGVRDCIGELARMTTDPFGGNNWAVYITYTPLSVHGPGTNTSLFYLNQAAPTSHLYS
jgi:hypothetical protein